MSLSRYGGVYLLGGHGAVQQLEQGVGIQTRGVVPEALLLGMLMSGMGQALRAASSNNHSRKAFNLGRLPHPDL
jgi:hypothetical protein